MADNNTLEELRLRANLYKILSVLYQVPSPAYDDYLSHLGTCLEKLLPGLEVRGEEMVDYFNHHKDDMTKLQVEYTQVFIGPFEVLVPPYSSIYTEEKPQIMGQSTMEAYQYYLDAGLDTELNFKQPPDHISTEMEFMYYLICQHFNMADGDFLERQGKFVNDHMTKWVFKFAEMLEAGAPSVFYKNLGFITKEFMMQEVKRFS